MASEHTTTSTNQVLSHCFLCYYIPNRQRVGMQNGSSVGMCTRRIHAFLHAWAPISHAQSLLSKKKFLHRSSGESLLRVRCWLGRAHDHARQVQSNRSCLDGCRYSRSPLITATVAYFSSFPHLPCATSEQTGPAVRINFSFFFFLTSTVHSTSSSFLAAWDGDGNPNQTCQTHISHTLTIIPCWKSRKTYVSLGLTNMSKR